MESIIHPRIAFRHKGKDVSIATFGDTDHISREISHSKMFYEIDLLNKCDELYIPGTSIVDVGAYIGNHTIFFSKILNAKVYAFEPNPRSFDLLKVNIRENGVDKSVDAYNMALGESRKKGVLFVPSDENMGRSMVKEDASGSLDIVSLDSLGLPAPVGIMKIDVEGGELAVLRGAVRTIQRNMPAIFVELIAREELYGVLSWMKIQHYVPVGRYAFTPTYMFVPADGARRLSRILRWLPGPRRPRSWWHRG